MKNNVNYFSLNQSNSSILNLSYKRCKINPENLKLTTKTQHEDPHLLDMFVVFQNLSSNSMISFVPNIICSARL